MNPNKSSRKRTHRALMAWMRWCRREQRNPPPYKDEIYEGGWEDALKSAEAALGTTMYDAGVDLTGIGKE